MCFYIQGSTHSVGQHRSWAAEFLLGQLFLSVRLDYDAKINTILRPDTRRLPTKLPAYQAYTIQTY